MDLNPGGLRFGALGWNCEQNHNAKKMVNKKITEWLNDCHLTCNHSKILTSICFLQQTWGVHFLKWWICTHGFHTQNTNADSFLSDQPRCGHETFFIDETFFRECSKPNKGKIHQSLKISIIYGQTKSVTVTVWASSSYNLGKYLIDQQENFMTSDPWHRWIITC